MGAFYPKLRKQSIKSDSISPSMARFSLFSGIVCRYSGRILASVQRKVFQHTDGDKLVLFLVPSSQTHSKGLYGNECNKTNTIYFDEGSSMPSYAFFHGPYERQLSTSEHYLESLFSSPRFTLIDTRQLHTRPAYTMIPMSSYVGQITQKSEIFTT